MSKKREIKKVLITSLGASEIYSPYTYRIDGDGTRDNCYFTGHALEKFYEYNSIIYVGTVKSQWEVLYLVHACSDCDSKICEMKEHRLKQNNNSDVENFEKSKCFIELKTSLTQKENNQKRDISLVVVKYGLKESELIDNYKVLKNILDNLVGDLKEDEVIDVTFDMTGSLRPLPVYQMVFINYFNALSKNNKIVMNKMFYSMFEARKEFNDVIPIIKLESILELLSLVSGVNEFNNTGSLYNLTYILEQKNMQLDYALDNLLSIFKQFDYASGVNDMTKQINSATKLVDELRNMIKKCSDDSLKDVFELLCKSINNKFFYNIDIIDDSWSDNIENIYLFQYNVSYWYYEQKRYGVAAATGLEALRTLLVGIYLEKKGIVVEKVNVNNERYRRDSLVLLRNKKLELEKRAEIYGLSRIESSIIRLENTRKELKKFRDCFAHNLSSEVESKEIIQSTEEYDEKIKIMKEFLDTLNEVYIALGKNKEIFDIIDTSSEKQELCDNQCFIVFFGKMGEEEKENLTKKYRKTSISYSIKFICIKDSTDVYSQGSQLLKQLKKYIILPEIILRFVFVNASISQGSICSIYIKEYLESIEVHNNSCKYQYDCGTLRDKAKMNDRCFDIANIKIDRIRSDMKVIRNVDM